MVQPKGGKHSMTLALENKSAEQEVFQLNSGKPKEKWYQKDTMEKPVLDYSEEKHKFFVPETWKNRDLAGYPGVHRRDGVFWIEPHYVSIYYMKQILLKRDFNISVKANKLVMSILKFENQRYNVKENNFNLSTPPPKWDMLTDLQKSGAAWLATGSGILADETGTGKTVQACQALNLLRPQNHTIIVCPNNVVDKWEKHIHDWTDFTTINMKKDEFDGAMYVEGKYPRNAIFIVSWTSLKKWAQTPGYREEDEPTEVEKEEKLFNWIPISLIIADEVHKAKNASAKQTRTLRGIHAERKWGLTATPLANTPIDFFNLLRWIIPDIWSSKQKFIHRHCQLDYDADGVPHIILKKHPVAKQTFDMLAGINFFSRSFKDVVGKDIEVEREIYETYMTEEHYKTYCDIRDMFITKVEGGILDPKNGLVAINRLTQLACASLKMGQRFNKKTQEDEDYVIDMIMPSPKASGLIDLLEKERQNSNSIVVMSASKKLINLCARLMHDKFNYDMVTGDTPQKDRPAIYDAFMTGETNILLTTAGVSAEGIDLDKADLIIQLHRLWSLIIKEQADGRLRRFTQKKDKIRIIDVVALGPQGQPTVDSKIRNRLNFKSVSLARLTRKEFVDLL